MAFANADLRRILAARAEQIAAEVRAERARPGRAAHRCRPVRPFPREPEDEHRLTSADYGIERRA